MSVSLSFNAGTLVTVTATFANEAGVATDPSTITLVYQPGPNQTIVTWAYGGAGSLTRAGTGIYVAELDTTELPGIWRGQWIGTGACQTTQPFAFQVLPLPLN